MSKSRGTFLRAKTWADHLPVEPLRYFFASRLSSRIDDLDLDLQEFQQKFNTDLVGKVVNIASRCVGFLADLFDNRLCELDESGQHLLQQLLQAQQSIHAEFEAVNFSQAVRQIMQLRI